MDGEDTGGFGGPAGAPSLRDIEDEEREHWHIQASQAVQALRALLYAIEGITADEFQQWVLEHRYNKLTRCGKRLSQACARAREITGD